MTTMAHYSNFSDFLLALINGGDEHFTADNFSSTALGRFASMQPQFWDWMTEWMTKEGTEMQGWLNHWFIRRGDMDENKKSVMSYISQKADKGFKVKEFFNDNEMPEHWNESVQGLIDEFNRMMGNDIEGGRIGTTDFFIEDILHADAGNDYGKLHPTEPIEDQHNADLHWVRPWRNIDGDSYKKVRDLDAIVSVLNSNHHSQYTRAPLNADAFNEELENQNPIIEGLTGIPDVFPVDGGDGLINALDASQLLAYINRGYGDLTPAQYYNLMQRLDIFREGTPAPLQVVASYTLSYYAYASTGGELSFPEWIELRRMGVKDEDMKANQYSTAVQRWLMERKEDYLRLIMPEYQRRVEVEDLNRNFWTIAQTLSAISCFLFANDNPIQSMFNKILDEEAQLWENILYLWAGAAIVGQRDKVTDIQVVVMPIPNSELQPYVKFDNFNDTVPPESIPFTTLVYYRFQELIESYPNSNLVIIPEIRMENYKHNYYAEAMYPCIFTYNRTTDITRTLELGDGRYKFSLKDWSDTHDLGGLKTKKTQYVYTPGWATSTASIEGGFYYALVRPEFVIDPYYDTDDDEIKFNLVDSTNDLIIKFHDVASELSEIATEICLTAKFQMGLQTVGEVYNTIAGTDEVFDITDGFYQGELISYPRNVNANFTATIEKVWIGDNIPVDKRARVGVTGFETDEDFSFYYGGTTTQSLVLPSKDNLEHPTEFVVTEGITKEGDEEWVTTFSPNNIITPQNTAITITNKLYNVRFTDADFQVVKIGDFYPATYLDGTRTIIPALSEITRKTSDGIDAYDTDTYGIGAYTLRKPNASIAWPLESQDYHVVFVDYYQYAQNGTISTTEGYSLTVAQLDTLSENYVTYLKANGKLGDIDSDGIYATKFGTSFWVGDAGSQWSGGIVHALVFYNGSTHTAKVISNPKLFDGYWTNDQNVFSVHGSGYAVSAWRRLCLKCSSLSICYTNNVPEFNMKGGKLIWYDHWNDINGSYGRRDPRPNANMILDNSQLIFNSEYNPYGAETRMAVNVQYNGTHIFFDGDDDRIGVRRDDYTVGGPIRFTQNYDNINLNAAGYGINCYIS